LLSIQGETAVIKKYVSDIARQMGMRLSRVTLVDGRTLGCRDLSLLNISSKECITSALIYPADLRDLEKGVICTQLEIRIRAALSRLQILIESKGPDTAGSFRKKTRCVGDVSMVQ
jgi:hypothetical protein